MYTSHLLSGRTWRMPVIAFCLYLCLLTSCADAGTSGVQSSSPSGPIQLFDVHGQLICQIHGAKAADSCLDSTSASHQYAAVFIRKAIDELASDLHTTKENLPSTALHVSTTLDLGLQKQIMQQTQKRIEVMHNLYNIGNASIVMLDYRTGAIRVLIGSLDGQIDVATQSTRMIGSLFKPFVYATAFEQGVSPGEVVYDGPFSIGSPPYSPSNYDGTFHEYQSYRSSLQNNYNIPALKLFVKEGPAAVKKTIEALGLYDQDIMEPGMYSTFLGTMEMPLLDVTAAYGAIANGGVHLPPHTVESISTPGHHVLFSTHSQGNQAISLQTAFMLTDIMSDTKALTAIYGVCSPMELYTATQEQCQAGNPGNVYPAAVHTGTTDTFKDNWVVGYTVDMVAGVWTGNSNFSPMVPSANELNGIAPIWHDSMLLAEGQKPVTPFPGSPAGLVKKTVSYPHLTTTDWYLSR